MSRVKEAITFDEQIQKLKSRGMIIEDELIAKHVLSNINYYRFTAYLLEYKNADDTYKRGITFNHIHNIYLFDKDLIILILDIIGVIEVSFRTYIAYTLGINHRALGYLEKSNFINSQYHKMFLLNLEKEKQKNINKLFIKHHINTYAGKLPIWVAVEILSFGQLSKLYSNLLPGDKTYIKNNMCNINISLVDTWMQSLTHLRNQCAHYGRIYNYQLPIIKVKKEYNQYNIDNKRVFAYILAIKHLLNDSTAWDKFYNKLISLIKENINIINLKLIGFPNNWDEILRQ